MDKELQRLPKKEELDQHIKELNKSVDELRDEISLVKTKWHHWLSLTTKPPMC